jgi:hypothetical protein
MSRNLSSLADAIVDKQIQTIGDDAALELLGQIAEGQNAEMRQRES